MHPVLILSEKRDQWKCCIKPLIGVEHIRIILHAQSGSCYAAAYVVPSAPEFSTRICGRARRARSAASVRAREACSRADPRRGRHRKVQRSDTRKPRVTAPGRISPFVKNAGPALRLSLSLSHPRVLIHPASHSWGWAVGDVSLSGHR